MCVYILKTHEWIEIESNYVVCIQLSLLSIPGVGPESEFRDASEEAMRHTKLRPPHSTKIRTFPLHIHQSLHKAATHVLSATSRFAVKVPVKGLGMRWKVR